MTEEDKECPWYIGESTRESVSENLSSQDEGTFVVFKPVDQSNYILASKAYDTVNFKEILSKDGLYGFTEPLQFECLEEALDTYNSNCHSRFGGTLRQPMGRHQSIYRNPRQSKNTAPAILLKRLRETDKQRADKDDEICDMQTKIKQQKEEFHNLSTEMNALNNVLRTLEKQTEKHKSLENELKHNPSEKDIVDLSDNYQRISARKAQVEQDIVRLQEEKTDMEKEIYNTTFSSHQCRLQVEQLLEELTTTQMEVMAIYPEFKEFIDNLLAEDTREPFIAKPVDISKGQAKANIKDREEGTFIIWKYKPPTHPYCITISSQKGPMHFPILVHDGYYGFDETTCIFESLRDLVMNYGKIPFRVHDDSLGDLTLRYEWKP